jgi:hypothetical protein
VKIGMPRCKRFSLIRRTGLNNDRVPLQRAGNV